uniref:Uncharacterized protein n=1 Tax=Timema tahoe TaxID=61484 RepID=A0A7R9ICM7_9NEOP|nr:unnamed protein product [Timema tahoe]
MLQFVTLAIDRTDNDEKVGIRIPGLQLDPTPALELNNTAELTGAESALLKLAMEATLKIC